MSMTEIERFAADVNSNAALRAEVETFAKGSKTESLDGLTALAAAKGYSFTADELMEQAKAAAKADKNLSDADLDNVAGGFFSGAAGNGFAMMIGMMLTGQITQMFPSGGGSSQT
jgi:predicted ribosomally synthesized peptide with nif11-like leader